MKFSKMILEHEPNRILIKQLFFFLFFKKFKKITNEYMIKTNKIPKTNNAQAFPKAIANPEILPL